MTFPPVKGSQMRYATALQADHLLRLTSVQGLWKRLPCSIWPAGLLISMLLYIFFPSGNYSCPLTCLILRTYREREMKTSLMKLKSKCIEMTWIRGESLWRIQWIKDWTQRLLCWILKKCREQKGSFRFGAFPEGAAILQEAEPGTLLPLLLLPEDLRCLHDASQRTMLT